MAGIRFEYAFVGGQTQLEWLMNFWKARNAANADGSFKCERRGGGGGGGGWKGSAPRGKKIKQVNNKKKIKTNILKNKW